MKQNRKNGETDSQPVRVEFYDERARKVSILGTFNHWNPRTTYMAPAGKGRWMRVLFLSAGKHELQFRVDVKEPEPPACPDLPHASRAGSEPHFTLRLARVGTRRKPQLAPDRHYHD